MRLLVLTVAAAVAAAVAALGTAAPAFAAGGVSYTWVGSSQDPRADNHSWTDARNWSPNGVPGDGDSVSIADPNATHCVAQVDDVPTVSVVNFSITATMCSSSITGGKLTVTGSFTWNGGTISTPTTITAGAVGTISGTNSHISTLSAELDVAGTLTLAGVPDAGASNTGGLRIVNPYVLHVLPGGTLNSAGANAVQYLSCCNSPAKIVNDGTLHVSAGDLVVRAVEVDQNGTLSADSGGRLVTVGAPVTAGTGATYSGTGGWKISNGAKAKLSGSQTINSGFHLELGGLDVDAGVQLGGTATLSGGGVLDWTGGTIEGNLTIAHGMTVHVSGPHTGNGKRFLSGQDGVSSLAASTLVNHGAVTVDQGATVLTGNQARLVNAADGTLTLAPGTQFGTISCCNSPSRIVNNGRLVVPSGVTTAPVLLSGVAYQASGGSTSVARGRVLRVSLAPSSLTATSITGGGALAVDAPTAAGGTIGLGAGTVLALQPGGSVDGTATIGGSGSLSWTGGALSGRLTVTTTGGVSVSGPDIKYVRNIGGGRTPSAVTIRSRTAVAAGTKTKHDRIDLGSSTLALASTTSVANFVDLAYGSLVNTGSLTIAAGTGGLAERAGSGPFTNRGSVAVRSGTFRVDGGYTQTAGTTDVAAGAHLNMLYVSRALGLAGGTFTGSGTVGAGVSNTGGVVRPGGTTTGTLHVSGAYAQGAKGTLVLDFAARTRDLLAVGGAVTLHGTLSARNLGSYRPASRVKYRVVAGSRLSYGLTCAMTSGSTASHGHWTPSHTSSALYLTWRSGARTHC
jgi:fibronectin-binding autotransporter adhesin